jgi:NAD(P)-dependent dehydrogenase (short-subunit alcohol dehydrogenase family)
MKTMDLFNLKGKTAIVTGGAVGLGRQMALGLAETGADIVICSRKLEKCEEMAYQIESLGVRTRALRCDLTLAEEVDQVVKETLKDFGKIDILVNNAGRTWGAPVEELKVEDWKKVIDLNITGTFQLTQRVGKEIKHVGQGKPQTRCIRARVARSRGGYQSGLQLFSYVGGEAKPTCRKSEWGAAADVGHRAKPNVQTKVAAHG